ncbi:UDP-glucose 4-epimerase GalE [Halovulum sp. GXIMD14794]
MSGSILVTGGAGFVGSHCAKTLAKQGFRPVVYDDLRRGNAWAVRWGPHVAAPLEDKDALLTAMRTHNVVAVMHFAAYAYVGESMSDPSAYFRNNVANAINVLDAMREAEVDSLVISSTCATYGEPDSIPIHEEMPQAPVNPYGSSKVMLEELARWYGAAHGLRTASLRYFNAAGSDPDGEIGEAHNPETHLIPLVVDAALGRRPSVTVNGTDYPTPDGTAVRDYIHVCDLADAHVAALRRITESGSGLTLNLGTGKGTSIREVIAAVTRAVGTAPVVEYGPRRQGDPPALVADPSRAEQALGWKAVRSEIDQIVSDTAAWRRARGSLIDHVA